MNTSNDSRIVQPYIFFNGRCEEALEFYRTALDAELLFMMRFRESPTPHPGEVPSNWGEKIMHASLRIGRTVIMVSDGVGEPPEFKNFYLSITVSTEADADSAFSALSQDGQVRMPIAKTFWSPRFGMVTDRFGLGWMIQCDDPNKPVLQT